MHALGRAAPCCSQCRARVAARPIARRLRQRAAAGGGSNNDFAVFRFTLGIPGFDDNDVPRVAGSVAAVLLAVNHVLSQSPVPAAQVRSEELGLLLALAAFFTPTLGKRLEEAARSGRRAAAVLPGSANTMRISEDEADATRRELAWATFAMLRNVNAAAVVIWGANGELLAARGQLPAAVAAGGVTLEEAVAQAAASEALGEAALAGPSYLPDAGAIGKAGAGGLALLPEGAQALWACPMKGRQGGGDAGRLLLVAAEPRAFSQKERAWAAAVAAKLGDVLQ